MRLAALMELILVAAVGMAVASWLIHDPRMAPYYTSAPRGRLLKDAADGFPIAVGLAYLAASPEPRPRADGREWAGRVFAVLTVITGIMNLFDGDVGF
jgi:hypothetical protein